MSEVRIERGKGASAPAGHRLDDLISGSGNGA